MFILYPSYSIICHDNIVYTADTGEVKIQKYLNKRVVLLTIKINWKKIVVMKSINFVVVNHK